VHLGRGIRQRRGGGGGKTVSLDRVTVTSRRLGLMGRSDRLIEAGATIIVEERKSPRRGRPSHRVQMGCYFLLIDVRYGLQYDPGRELRAALIASARP
jgi:CRISPR-associated exonuclease Cas4